MAMRKQAQHSPDEENAPMMLFEEENEHDNNPDTTTGTANTDANADEHPPFQTLEEATMTAVAVDSSTVPCDVSFCSPKKAILSCVFGILLFVLYEAIFVPKEERLFQPKAGITSFLLWADDHPVEGWFAIVLLISVVLVTLLPLGAPLFMGCGYVYKGAYGWTMGIPIATLASMGGSTLGAVLCFLLGRYLFREKVRNWARSKYPMFDAIDAAASEQGLRLMAMLYLTPVIPLGPLCYMCGTTSISLSSFAFARIAATPLMMLYCFIGASSGTLVSSSSDTDEDNKALIIPGMLLSFVMIAVITRYIQKELNIILERQEIHRGEKVELELSTPY
eukprot:CAMPEP_0198146128 /NCGR_PEP_ID=MMETSP1443-20131203/27564_1 /TAXON_ID=186043 /ORGANISM="Entomoneis sp., Strain CCMP2396" /LENGTH=334 /DNA_ID=CAMNT_0043809973 /DNA_START=175 /DNA_END=1179 /DNA_ORIENTATION=-